MTTVKLRLPQNRLDIAALNVSFAGLPIASASVEVMAGPHGDLHDVEEMLRVYFADGASWRRGRRHRPHGDRRIRRTAAGTGAGRGESAQQSSPVWSRRAR
ncbi:hypothetical protein ACFXP3_13710 [Streptomyces sp. NPDC059096]|uniref:hypothetical protein n=1 Tax=Streptomyces sp. NPDC059096 TaxID=3346727 RepID=UPI0036C29EA5